MSDHKKPTLPFANQYKIIKSKTASYEYISTVGTGSFGVVIKAKNCETGQIVAIKRVLQDVRYKVCILIFM